MDHELSGVETSILTGLGAWVSTHGYWVAPLPHGIHVHILLQQEGLGLSRMWRCHIEDLSAECVDKSLLEALTAVYRSASCLALRLELAAEALRHDLEECAA